MSIITLNIMGDDSEMEELDIDALSRDEDDDDFDDGLEAHASDR